MQRINKVLTLTFSASFLTLVSFAQDAAAPAAAATTGTAGGNFLLTRYLLVGIAVLLAFIILILSGGIKAAADLNIEKQKESRSNKTIVLTVTGLLFSFSSLAQDTTVLTAPVAPKLSLPFDIYIYLAVIVLELIVIISEVFALYRLLGLKQKARAAKAAAGIKKRSFFQKINNTVAVEEEDKLDMEHNYDGIRELDNKVPGWWQWAFIATILFGVIYLYRMFIGGTMPDQFTELQLANEEAAVKQAAALKNSANNVDENTVKMMDAAGVAAGADLYSKNCIACHGDKGQGSVGPNLTDNYWLHKGSINDIFKVIKYGVPEKGMRAWKDDFSPVQIAQLASFVQSIKGTNPPGAKEPQGEPEAGGTAPADTPAADTATAVK